uniref:(northern house mosquito) hypothetical protein n=1 Tax=Culex pipiens TaxID=7175 RepID=A0A8D8C5D6_CULPI
MAWIGLFLNRTIFVFGLAIRFFYQYKLKRGSKGYLWGALQWAAWCVCEPFNRRYSKETQIVNLSSQYNTFKDSRFKKYKPRKKYFINLSLEIKLQFLFVKILLVIFFNSLAKSS